MTDRELLELAAKAAGLAGQWTKTIGGWDCLAVNGSPLGLWMPLQDDGDALRLAVDIGPLEFSISEYGAAVRQPNGQWFGCEAHLPGGKKAAIRRAIVRAAAEIAKAGEPKCVVEKV